MRSAWIVFREFVLGLVLSFAIAALTRIGSFFLIVVEEHFPVPETVFYDFFKVLLDTLGYGGSLILLFIFARSGVIRYNHREQMELSALPKLPKSKAHKRGKK